MHPHEKRILIHSVYRRVSFHMLTDHVTGRFHFRATSRHAEPGNQLKRA